MLEKLKDFIKVSVKEALSEFIGVSEDKKEEEPGQPGPLIGPSGFSLRK